MDNERKITVDGRKLYIYPANQVAGKPFSYEVFTYSLYTDKIAFNLSIKGHKQHLKEDSYYFRIDNVWHNGQRKWQASVNSRKHFRRTITLAPANTIVQAIRNGLNATRHLSYF